MKAIILAGGSPKEIKLITGKKESRSLLKFPRGTLLDIYLNIILRYFDSAIVVSDDGKVADYCYNVPGCIFVEQKLGGIEGALCSALASESVAGEQLITVIYGDIYAEDSMLSAHIARVFKDYEPLITVTKPVVLRGTFLKIDADPIDQRVLSVGSGPYVYAGILTADAGTLRSLLCKDGKTVHEAIQELAKKGLRANIWLGEWVDIDTPWDYLLAIRLDLEKIRGIRIENEANVAETAILEGTVYVAKGARIDHNAVIKGPAYIGKNALVGTNAFIRDHVAIFESSIIGAFSEIKRSVVYTRAKIASHSYIADSLVGAYANVAPYTLTINIPYGEVKEEVRLTSTQPLEAFKVGAIITAYSKTEPREVIKPATIYTK
ncbi:NDP-sugar synthase [Pyrofollis japonicus]|uniref:hypothetical protein n=1 Tax=Pyrofollis japonicus TaxID=3060460 RepID=UPI00295B9462|nr:hypothetical protein [Pyrofollis japonicus]BEP16972.1 NDP-sugar synthase [Pyrofollis japonicus]